MNRGNRRRAEHALRSGPEWVVFGVAAAILATVVVVLAVLALAGSVPAAPHAEVGEVSPVDGRFLVPVDVVNRGDFGASNVQVQAELTVDGTTTTADQVIDFLGRDESRRLTFVFTDDPSEGELEVGVTSFADP
jgi:uncharacterized protein (TIGR02588 family)